MDAKNGGFSSRNERSIVLPAHFFGALLGDIDDLAELKVTLFCLYALEQKEGNYRYLRHDEFIAAEDLMRGLAGLDAAQAPPEILDSALEKAVTRGTLLQAQLDWEGGSRRCYFISDEHGRLLHQQVQAGEWRPAAADEIEILPPRPTVYQLYEENIGILTPMIAEAIKEAALTYPQNWIEEAMRYAVERNVRNWRYISKVLEGWQQEGRSHEAHGRSNERRKKYKAGKWKDFIE